MNEKHVECQAGHEWHTLGHPNVCARCNLCRIFKRVMGSGQPEYEYFVNLPSKSGENNRKVVSLTYCRRTRDSRPSAWEWLLDDPLSR
jgi:hypothetical protein